MVPTSPGTVLDDRYELSRRLGSGGTASVWAARDLLTNAHVAVKVLHPQLRVQEKNRARFEREAAALEKLDHPHIAKLLHHRLDHHTPYLVLELLVGSTLAELIGSHATANVPLPLPRALAIFEQIASAVSFAHERGILHRDLKPGNVMVDPTKVLDFGLAKLGEGPSDQATTRGRYIGSYFYMSPEQARGEPATQASDIFGLGCLLYEMLTLRRTWAKDKNGEPLVAFGGERAANSFNSPPEIMARIRSEPRPRPSAIVADLSRLDAVIERALAIEPEDRFASVHELMEEVLACGGADTTMVAMEGTLYETELVEREKMPGSFWWMAAGAALLSAVVSVQLWPVPRTEPEIVDIPVHATPTVEATISVRPKSIAPGPELAEERGPRTIAPKITPAPEVPVTAKRASRLERLLRKLEADPANLELMADVGRELEVRARSIGDPIKRERIERIAVSSVMAGDAAGLRQAARELAEAQ